MRRIIADDSRRPRVGATPTDPPTSPWRIPHVRPFLHALDCALLAALLALAGLAVAAGPAQAPADDAPGGDEALRRDRSPAPT